MFNRNEDIKRARGNIPNWAIAEKLGVSENTLYRWLRQELPAEKKKSIYKAIKQVQEEISQTT